ncbi:MAG: flagellar biosynthesis anti-sigma factor FlgM [SAR324 cluster bacterium]|nr:flagellar biosynthesis anti-sigma factor FlgM [SAR324 cluster bacterium]
MKVTGQDPAKIADLTLAKSKGKQSAQPTSKERASSESAPARTRASLTMDRVKQAIRLEPDVRSERVAQLRAKIKSGEYQVDSGKLAEKILVDSLREDLEKP